MDKLSLKKWSQSQTAPEILTLQRNGDQIEIEILVSPYLFQFQGHFPDQPIFPGVAQLDWVARMAAEHFDDPGEIIGLSQIKFANLIEPGNRLHLKLDLQREKNRIAFKYFREGQVCSSGFLDLSSR
jgi:3-hydroxymyristoyl/3-hydroxydecanoyl-(acyl carrier protein) dehydratase